MKKITLIVTALLLALAIPSLAQASSQYPYPSGLIGSKSTSGSAINPYKACYPTSLGGTDSAYYAWFNRFEFEATSRGKKPGAYFASTAIGSFSPYESTCLNQFIYQNAFGVTERQNAVTYVYGHGNTITGRDEQSWTGNVPFYGDGDSRTGAPQYICTNGWKPTTAC